MRRNRVRSSVFLSYWHIALSSHRAAILDSHPDFLVTSDSWPAFLYEGERFDSKDPRKGLFKNLLLLKVRERCLVRSSSNWMAWRPSNIYSHRRAQPSRRILRVNMLCSRRGNTSLTNVVPVLTLQPYLEWNPSVRVRLHTSQSRYLTCFLCETGTHSFRY